VILLASSSNQSKHAYQTSVQLYHDEVFFQECYFQHRAIEKSRLRRDFSISGGKTPVHASVAGGARHARMDGSFAPTVSMALIFSTRQFFPQSMSLPHLSGDIEDKKRIVVDP
jgi:hypothetical protein